MDTQKQSRAKAKVVRTTISMPFILMQAAEKICAERGYSGLSDYFQAKVRADGGLEKAAA